MVGAWSSSLHPQCEQALRLGELEGSVLGNSLGQGLGVADRDFCYGAVNQSLPRNPGQPCHGEWKNTGLELESGSNPTSVTDQLCNLE